MLSVVYADCYLCWVSHISPLCWVSLCWMSLCWFDHLTTATRLMVSCFYFFQKAVDPLSSSRPCPGCRRVIAPNLRCRCRYRCRWRKRSRSRRLTRRPNPFPEPTRPLSRRCQPFLTSSLIVTTDDNKQVYFGERSFLELGFSSNWTSFGRLTNSLVA